jgi:hypothetical protein
MHLRVNRLKERQLAVAFDGGTGRFAEAREKCVSEWYGRLSLRAEPVEKADLFA